MKELTVKCLPLDEISRDQENFGLTPEIVVRSFSRNFDLDPCASPNQKHHFAVDNWTNDFSAWRKHWKGMVFLHPPANSETGRWIAALRNHSNGILMYKQSRLDRQAYRKHINNRVSGYILLDRDVEVPFCNIHGEIIGSYMDRFNFYSYGNEAAQVLSDTSIPGERHFFAKAYAEVDFSYKPKQLTENIN